MSLKCQHHNPSPQLQAITDSSFPELAVLSAIPSSRSSCNMFTPCTYPSLRRRVSFPAWPAPVVVSSKSAPVPSVFAVFSVPVLAVSVQNGWPMSASVTSGHTSSLSVHCLSEGMLHQTHHAVQELLQFLLLLYIPTFFQLPLNHLEKRAESCVTACLLCCKRLLWGPPLPSKFLLAKDRHKALPPSPAS